MKIYRAIYLLVLALGWWITPSQMASAGACCQQPIKAIVAKASGCDDQCGCCCTTPQVSEVASTRCPGEAKHAADQGATCGSSCRDCTCMASAPASPAPLIPVVPPPARSIAPELALPRASQTFDFAPSLESVSLHTHEFVCWTGPPVYLLNDVFRI